MTIKELLELAALAESYSDHPISRSIAAAFGKNVDTGRVQNVEEISGHGIKAEVDGKTVLAGNEKLMGKFGISIVRAEQAGTIVYLAENGRFAGTVVISDTVKPVSYTHLDVYKRQPAALADGSQADECQIEIPGMPAGRQDNGRCV